MAGRPVMHFLKDQQLFYYTEINRCGWAKHCVRECVSIYNSVCVFEKVCVGECVCLGLSIFKSVCEIVQFKWRDKCAVSFLNENLCEGVCYCVSVFVRVHVRVCVCSSVMLKSRDLCFIFKFKHLFSKLNLFFISDS